MQLVKEKTFWPSTKNKPLEPSKEKATLSRSKRNRKKRKDEPKKDDKLTKRGGTKTYSNCR